MRIAVMGMGSWGTAFAQVLADNDHQVVLWGRDDATVAALNVDHRNHRFYPDVTLPASISAAVEPAAVLSQAELVVLALPAQTLRSNLSAWGASVPDQVPVVSLAKGLEQQTGARMSQVVAAALPPDRNPVAVLSGPNLAREIILRQPAATVVAAEDESVACAIQQACHTAYFRPYTNTDVVGVEVAGVVKNVIALASGMAKGLGYGDNAQAAIITRGLAEMTRLGLALGASPMTFMGLAGVGDLVATCLSPLSRNHTFGENLGRGMSVDEVTAATHQTAEGVKSAPAVLDLGRRLGVDLPITQHVASVVRDGLSPTAMVVALMSREAKPEWEQGTP
jgi:glycerol-3-phosphate dehydrogenase (NAD(P)+)